MAKLYVPHKNGGYSGGGPDPRYVVSAEKGPFSFIPFGNAGIQDWAFYLNSGFEAPAAAEATLTTTNSGTIGCAAGGLAIVSGATSGNNTTFQYLRGILPATNKRFAFVCRMNWTVVAKGVGAFGLWATAADPVTGTDPTDGVYFSKDTAGTGAIKANFVGNSTVVTAVAVHTAVLATDYEYGLVYTPTSATNGSCSFYQRAVGAGWGNPVTTMTATTGNGLAAVLRLSANIDATDANALTATYAYYGCAMEL